MSIALASRSEAPAPAGALEAARRRISPRYAEPRGIAWPAMLIHGGLTLLWLALLVRAFRPDGLWSWAAGLLYIAYDTALLLFVFWKTLPLVGGAAGAARARGMDSAGNSRPSLALVVIQRGVRLLQRLAEPLEGVVQPPARGGAERS